MPTGLFAIFIPYEIPQQAQAVAKKPLRYWRLWLYNMHMYLLLLGKKYNAYIHKTSMSAILNSVHIILEENICFHISPNSSTS